MILLTFSTMTKSSSMVCLMLHLSSPKISLILNTILLLKLVLTQRWKKKKRKSITNKKKVMKNRLNPIIKCKIMMKKSNKMDRQLRIKMVRVSSNKLWINNHKQLTAKRKSLRNICASGRLLTQLAWDHTKLKTEGTTLKLTTIRQLNWSDTF